MKAIPFESYEVFRSLCSSQAPAFDVDLCSIVVNATRYSLGRRTYMPSVVSDFIKRHISQLDDETLNRVISIVREYLMVVILDGCHFPDCQLERNCRQRLQKELLLGKT